MLCYGMIRNICVLELHAFHARSGHPCAKLSSAPLLLTNHSFFVGRKR